MGLPTYLFSWRMYSTKIIWQVNKPLLKQMVSWRRADYILCKILNWAKRLYKVEFCIGIIVCKIIMEGMIKNFWHRVETLIDLNISIFTLIFTVIIPAYIYTFATYLLNWNVISCIESDLKIKKFQCIFSFLW